MILLDCFSKNVIIKNCDFYALGLSNSCVGKPFLSYIDDTKYIDEINLNKEICGIITSMKIYESVRLEPHIIGIVLVDNPRKAYFELHNRLSLDKEYYSSDFVDTVIGKGCSISPYARIDKKGIIIGDNVIIEDGAIIKSPCQIGNNTVIHSGVKIGGDGYEFKRYTDNVLDVRHCGMVEIGENAVIWENTTIHKAVYPWDKTIIGNWCRIGAQSHIDHGAKIYDFTEICARCIISGRVHIGKRSFVGPGSIISNRVRIGNEGKILLGSVVTRDVSDGAIVSGNFAIEHDKHMKRVKADSEMVYR